MPEKKISLKIPSELVDTLQLEIGKEVPINIDGDRVYFKTKQQKQAISLRTFLIPSVISSLMFIFFFSVKSINQIPLTGRVSIASLVIIIGLFSGMISFLLIFIKAKKEKVITQSKDIYWRNLPAVMLSISIALFLFLLTFFKIIGLVFKGASFDLYTATLLFLIFVSIINYIMIYSALTVTPSLLINVLILVFVCGVGLAMVTNRDYLWWQHNFSFLGTSEARHRWEFNLTLILSAILMIALIDYLFVYLNQSLNAKKRLLTLKILLILTAINLGGVGAFPYSANSLSGNLHNIVAANLVYLIVLLIISIRWLLPQISKQFLTTSYLLGGLLVLSCVLFLGVHYLSLTAFELIAFMIAFSWILLLLQALQQLTHQGQNLTITVIELANDTN